MSSEQKRKTCTYSSLLKPEIVEEIPVRLDKERLYSEFIFQYPKKPRASVFNRIPKKTSGDNYDYWEHKYSDHLLQLFDIFTKGIEDLDVKTNIDTNSPSFFNNFIFDCSSGEISDYL